MKKIKIGIIGCGTIGCALAKKFSSDKYSDKVDISYICDIDKNSADKLINSINVSTGPNVVELDELVERSDLVFETACREVVPAVIDSALKHSRDIVIISVGGILDCIDKLERVRGSSMRMYVPSGAIAGIDGLKAARLSQLDSIVITTKKPPAGLLGAPYIVKNKIDLDSIAQETVIFQGTAVEAIKAFPKNINVSAVLSLAGLGPEKVIVKIVVNPNSERNIHEVEVTGDFGVIRTYCENLPSPTNPKTSYLAVLSAEAVLCGILNNIQIGT